MPILKSMWQKKTGKGEMMITNEIRSRETLSYALTNDQLFHLLNCKPLRSDSRYLENCLSQQFAEHDKEK